MNDRARLEVSILIGALALGVLADVLLRSHPWGANFALWATILAAVVFWLGREQGKGFGKGGGWLMLPLLLAPFAFLWHESPTLDALNLLALLMALTLLILRGQGGRLRVSSLLQYAVAGIIAGVNTALGIFPLLFGHSEWRKSAAASPRSAAIVRGTAFSLIPLVVFGSLMMGADAVFQNLVHRVFHIDFTHVAVVGILTMCIGGYLRGLLLGDELKLGALNRTAAFAQGSIEVGVMLGLLDLLFLAFVAVQIRYFFGGSALVHATVGLTYAEYARSGFFQLLAVATLVLPFLLLAHWLLRPDDVAAHRLFRWLAGIQIALLFVIMASAVQRMRLYEAEYGLSEQRLYPTAFMGWLAVVFVWFVLTVMRGRRERFAFGAMVAGFALIAALHLVNPDGLIARTNIARARAGRAFDARYLGQLSADAVPEVVAGLPDLKTADRCTVAKDLLAHGSSSENPDWRSWSYSRSQARQAVSDNASALHAACGEQRN